MADQIDWKSRAERAEKAAEETRELAIMQLAGISTATVQNTETTIKDRIDQDNPYWTQAYGDVCVAIDREIRERNRAERAEKACAEMRNICEGILNASKEQFGWPLAIWTHLVYAAENALLTTCGSGYVRREELEAAKADVEKLREEIKTLQVDLSCLRGALSLIAKGKWNVGKPYSVTVTAFAKNALKLVTCSTTPPLATSITNTAP